MTSIDVLRSIGYPYGDDFINRQPIESKKLYKIAKDNKISSLYLKSLDEEGELTQLTEEFEHCHTSQENMNISYSNLSDTLDDFEYVIVKTEKDFWADFSDIDVLVKDRDIRNIKQRLINNNYTISASAPSALSVRDPDTNFPIDIQTFFGLHEIRYFDENQIWKNRMVKNKNGLDLSVPDPATDIALQIDHSLTELLFLLKEYYSFVYFLEESSSKRVHKLINNIKISKSTPGFSSFFAIVLELSKKAFSRYPAHTDILLDEFQPTDSVNINECEFPYRYPITTLLRYTTSKMRQCTFRRSILHQSHSLMNPRTLFYFISKSKKRLQRGSY